jgi:beta-phosphoglucomutase-like phosphatase (HAD superfamily)
MLGRSGKKTDRRSFVADKKKTADRQKNPTLPRRAILFELENVAVKGRQIMFDQLKEILKTKDIEFSPAMFSRYCLCQPPRAFVRPILGLAGKTRLSEQKLVEEIAEKTAEAFKNDRLKLEPALRKLLKEMADRSILAGAVTSLEKGAADTLASHLGLPSLGVRLLHVDSDNRCFTGVDAWLKLARTLSVAPACCAVLATSGPSCRSATAAWMHCIAMPDRFTAFQDFGGSDLVVDTLDALAADDVSALLEPPR